MSASSFCPLPLLPLLFFYPACSNVMFLPRGQIYASFDHWTLHFPIESRTSWTFAAKLEHRIRGFKSRFTTNFAEHRQQLRSDLTDLVTVATVAALVALVLSIVKCARCPTVNLCLPTKTPSKPTPPSTDSTVQYSTQDTPRQTSSDASDPTDRLITPSPTASSPHPAPSWIKHDARIASQT